MSIARLDHERALLMVIDLQEKLLPGIPDAERLLRRVEVLIRAFRILGIPILVTEQNPERLGATNPKILEAVGEGTAPIGKLTFGCLACEEVAEAAYATERDQLILCGIETHVCILQTALQGMDEEWDVFLAVDAIASRRPADHETALRRLEQAGAVPASVEMLIMEALSRAGTEQFKAILPLVKEL